MWLMAFSIEQSFHDSLFPSFAPDKPFHLNDVHDRLSKHCHHLIQIDWYLYYQIYQIVQAFQPRRCDTTAV